jgi:hypothetical protein
MAYSRSTWNSVVSSGLQPNTQDADELEAGVEQAVAACSGDMRSTIHALIVANDYLETEVGELMKAVSHVRGRFHAIPARSEPWRK